MAGVAGDVTRDEVVRAARRRFLRGERLDLLSLSAELGIARATIYRWHGGREQLLGEVLWSLSEQTLDRALAGDRPPGVRGLVEALIRLMGDVAGNPAMRRLLDSEPQLALAALTSREGVVQSRLVDRIGRLIADECPHAAAGGMEVDDLAYAITRIGEAFCYADVIAGREVDIERARPLMLRLLGER
jgi:AcrR family transcriptional regulator